MSPKTAYAIQQLIERKLAQGAAEFEFVSATNAILHDLPFVEEQNQVRNLSMTHDAYSTKRVTVWDEARAGVPGKAVKYQDGYTSWCPDTVFERDYQAVSAMSFGHAVHALKAGHRVCRQGWNGKGMFLLLVPGSTGLTVDEGRPLAKAGLPIGTKFNYLPHIDMWTAQGDFVPWLASQTDVLADDWMICAPDDKQA
jgi:hypothetical protein